jgi:hypothetical protein
MTTRPTVGNKSVLWSLTESLRHPLLVYGTNFQDFPELKHNISYFWIICGVVTAIVVRIFVYALGAFAYLVRLGVL